VSWEVRQGDALALLLDLGDSSIDGLVTDPPYSSGGAFRADRMAATSTKYEQSQQALKRPEFSGDNRDQRAYGYWCALWLSECLRVCKPGAPVAIFTDWRQLPTTIDAIQGGGWIWRGIVPWNKTEAVRPQMGRFRAQCEYVVWGSSGPMAQRTDVGVLPGFFEGRDHPNNRDHMASKPVSVMREIVRVVPPGGLVLDPFMGCGSTGVACIREGRRFLGFELLQANIEIAKCNLRGPLFAEAEAGA